MVWVWAGIRWIHLLAAMIWVGGQLFLVLVLQPVLRRELPAAQRIQLVATVGRRYGHISWAALALLVITGFLNGVHRHLHWAALPTADSPYAHTLLVKLGFVVLVLIMTILHGQVVGPRLTRLATSAGSNPSVAASYRRMLRLSVAITSLNLLLNLAIVFLSARLVS
ncbi:DUF4149 domain-containing protein [Thermorudis peleae]|uniref:DUF4149 domain-containing protein n=1 Tax=Thermorudis peleae TaxID=1382356 RepID=UPI00056FD223|nr:DUF4149 domain-containing protein [Thermorudis peleae]